MKFLWLSPKTPTDTVTTPSRYPLYKDILKRNVVKQIDSLNTKKTKLLI